MEATSLPLSQVVTHGSLRIGFVEGFTLVSTEPDLLLAEAHKLDVDVLCYAGTHRFDAFEYMDKFFVNPGSATGAPTTGWLASENEEMVPSFCLMDVSLLFLCSSSLSLSFREYSATLQDLIRSSKADDPPSLHKQVQGISLTLYVYQLRKDEKGVENVAVEKVTYTKPVEPTAAAGSSSSSS